MKLKVENLSGGYGKREILRGITFDLHAGEVLCVLGPNGCGKSTLLKLLLRFLPQTGGRIMLGDRDTGGMDRKTLAQFFSYIPQSDGMMFPYTILEMVTMGRSCHIGRWRTPSGNDTRLAYEALEKVGIPHMADKLYTTLSGGERQLVLIARALCQDTDILIMDEPTASLDFANQQLIMEAVQTSIGEGRSVIMTTHSPSQPFAIATKVLLLSEGSKVGLGEPLNVLTNESLEEVYGIPMDVVAVTDRHYNERSICLPVH